METGSVSVGSTSGGTSGAANASQASGVSQSQGVELGKTSAGSDRGSQGASKLESQTSQTNSNADKNSNALDSQKSPTQAQAKALKELAADDMEALVTVQVNGKPEKVPVKEVLKHYGLDKAAYAKMEEASKIKKQAEQREAMVKQDVQKLKQFAKENPKDFLKLFGVEPDEFAEMTLADKFKLMQMTPEQRELAELRAEKAQREKEAKERQQQDKMTQEQKQEFETAQGIQKELVEAMESPEWKGSGLPSDKKFAVFIAQEMLMAESQKRSGHREQALSAKEAAGNVKEYVLNLVKTIADNASPEVLSQMLSESNIKKIREFELNRVTGKTAPTVSSLSTRPDDSQSSASTNDRPKKPMTEDEWRAYMRSR